jgi:ferritin
MEKKLTDGINSQMNFEIYSAYIYLAMSSYLKGIGLNGAANWMKVQAQEEMVHVNDFYDFLHDRGECPELAAINKPPVKWDSPLAAFEHAYKHEQIVSSRINKLVDMALDIRDHAANAFLQKYVSEQIEEEASVHDVVQQLKLVEGAPQGLFMVDRELGQRVFTPPVKKA